MAAEKNNVTEIKNSKALVSIAESVEKIVNGSSLQVRNGERNGLIQKNSLYLTLINNMTIYYISALLLIVGWVFNNFKGLSTKSDNFQFSELVANYNNIIFPVFGIIIANISFYGIVSTLWYLYFLTFLQLCDLNLINHTETNIYQTPKYEVYAHLPYAIISHAIPALILLLIFIKLPEWIFLLSTSVFFWSITLYIIFLTLFLICVGVNAFSYRELLSIRKNFIKLK